MKKILLVSFYYYPCTLTPAQRISYWANHLYKIGYYPTVVTRQWEKGIKSHLDTKGPLGNTVLYEKYETHEVYYLPFKPGILDKAYLKFGQGKLRILFLAVKFLDVLLAFFSLRFTSYANFLPFLRQLIDQNSFHKMIISGEPFYLFRLGYSLRNRIRWIADYRDDWTTNELQMNKKGGAVRKIIAKLEARYEQKWVKTADSIISVSELYTERLKNFLKLPGITIENGYEDEVLQLPEVALFDEFTIVYSGILYPSQDLRIIFDALKMAINQGNPFKILFLGAAFDINERDRIEGMLSSDMKPYVTVTERLDRNEALQVLQKAHVFLAIAYGDSKGIPSSKIYEYLALRKPIVLCPSDRDVMAKMIEESGLGFTANNSKEFLSAINDIQKKYSDNKLQDMRIRALPIIMKYSRNNQMAKLVTLNE